LWSGTAAGAHRQAGQVELAIAPDSCQVQNLVDCGASAGRPVGDDGIGHESPDDLEHVLADEICGLAVSVGRVDARRETHQFFSPDPVVDGGGGLVSTEDQ